MKIINNTDEPHKEITSSLLDAFELLRATKDDLKVSGGFKIISHLQKIENERSLQYTLKRLIRSLGANAPDIRMGYFATLVSLLTKFEQINVPHILDLVKKELHASGSSKSEVGDVALGQILTCGAIFRSGLMLRSIEEEQKQVLELLQTASTKKSYLSNVASLILLDFVNQLNEDQFETIVWKNIKKELKKDVKEHTLDSLYFLLVVNSKFPQKVKLRKLLGVPEILHEDNIPEICEKLMIGVDFNSLNHPIYNEIGTLIAKSPHLQLFWNKIDSYLVKHNRNRELVSLNMLRTILHNLQDNVSVILDLFSDNFFKLYMDWFKGLQTASKIRNKRDNEDDNKIMIKKGREVLVALAKVLKLPSVDDKIRLAMLKKLLFHPGEINFTGITGSTVVKCIIVDLGEGGLKKFAKLLKKVLLNTSKKFIEENVERNWYNNERVKAAELISFVVSHEAVKDDIDFKISYMQLLMCFGFFKIGGDENMAISTELAGSIKTCFYRCFTSRFSNVDSLVTVLSSLSNFISSMMEKDKVREKLEKQFPKENMDCWEMLTGICQQLDKNESKSKVDNVFLILLYQLGLFLFSEPVHVKIARSSIVELKSCYEHYKKGLKKNGKKKPNLTDEPEWVEVMVEVLLSILSIESSVLRSVVQCVFRLLWEYLTPSSIGQIVSVLDPESESNPLREQKDSDSEDEAESNESEDSEDEATKENEEVANGEISDESGSEIENEEEMKIPEQLRTAVQKALGAAAAPDTDAESIDADMISEEEGKKLDEALAEAFKQFNQGKSKISKKDRKNKKALSDFRIKVLDLIDIYLEKDPAMDMCLGLMAPLIRCLESCMQDGQFNELENRLRKSIKNLTKIRKFTSTGDVTVDILGESLKSIMDKGDRSHFVYQALGDVITHFATFIIYCTQKVETNASKSSKDNSFVDIFKDAVDNYFRNRNCMLPIIFFHNILQAEWNGKYLLIPIIIKNVFDNSVRQFRRNEGLSLIIGFYQGLNRFKPDMDETKREIIDIEKCFYSEFTQFKSDKEIDVKQNFLTTLRKLINIMRMFHENSKIDSNLDFQVLLNEAASIKCTTSKKNVEMANKQNGVHTKKTKKKKRKLVQMNGQQEPQAKKSKTESSDSD